MNSSHGRRSCLKFQVKYNRSIHRSIFTDIIAPAPIFDNGLSLFCYAGKEDYANLDEYAKTRSNPYNTTDRNRLSLPERPFQSPSKGSWMFSPDRLMEKSG